MTSFIHKILHIWCTTLENKISFWKKWRSRLRVKSDRSPDVCKQNSTHRCHCVKPFPCSSSIAQQKQHGLHAGLVITHTKCVDALNMERYTDYKCHYVFYKYIRIILWFLRNLISLIDVQTILWIFEEWGDGWLGPDKKIYIDLNKHPRI